MNVPRDEIECGPKIVHPMTTSYGERVHVLKTLAEPFAEVWAGRKPFEWRSTADREFRVGDFVRLREWIPPAGAPGDYGRYTGREIIARVPYVLSSGFGIPAGFAILSLDVMARTEPGKFER